MKSGYDQFFKQIRKQPNPKTKVTLRMQDPNAPKDRVVRSSSSRPIGSPSKSNSTQRSNVSNTPSQKDKRRRLKTPPVTMIVGLAIGLGVSIYGLLAPNALERLSGVFEIHFLGAASAADAEKPAAEKDAKAEKSAETKEAKSESPALSKPTCSPEEMSYLGKLNERKKELDLREGELNKLDEELQQQKAMLEKRLQQLEQTRTQIADTLKNQVTIDKEKVDKLVEFYSNMKPQQAAKIIESLNEDLAVETLGRMKKKNAAEIMNLLDPKKAQSISEKFAGYKRS
jgi:flagellar motility protein MotE (MotC chaperone)